MNIIEVIGELEHQMGRPIHDPSFQDYTVEVNVGPLDEKVEVEVYHNIRVITVTGNVTKQEQS